MFLKWLNIMIIIMLNISDNKKFKKSPQGKEKGKELG